MNIVVGSKVFFGRTFGERTLGEVIKVNRMTAKVRTLESRGTIRDYAVGTVFKVPFSLLTLADAVAAPQAPLGPTYGGLTEYPMPTPKKRTHQEILVDIGITYMELEPERLTADGERSRTEVRRLYSSLQAKLKGLFREIGRTVEENEALEALRERRRASAPQWMNPW